MKLRFGLLLVLSMVVLVGCSSNPLGMSDAEWEALTPQQQLVARTKQAELDEQARLRREQARIAKEAEQARLENLRHNAPRGEVVQCTLTNARARFAHNEWHPAQPMAVAIHRSEDRRQVSVAQEGRPSRNVSLHMGFDGMVVKVCRWYDRDCAVLAGTDRDYNRGHSGRIQVPDLVEGTLSCSFPGADDSRRYRR